MTDPAGSLRRVWAESHLHDAETPLAAGRMRTSYVLDHYWDGDEMGWPAEFAWLDLHQDQALWTLAVDIRERGIQTPIRLGNDGRVWDGHHRLRVAVLLGLDEVPVEVVR